MQKGADVAGYYFSQHISHCKIAYYYVVISVVIFRTGKIGLRRQIEESETMKITWLSYFDDGSRFET